MLLLVLRITNILLKRLKMFKTLKNIKRSKLCQFLSKNSFTINPFLYFLNIIFFSMFLLFKGHLRKIPEAAIWRRSVNMCSSVL